MIQFQLIKTYPGSPKLKTIITKQNKDKYVDDRGNIYIISSIESFPNFWKEVELFHTTRDGFKIKQTDRFYYIEPFGKEILQFNPKTSDKFPSNIIIFKELQNAMEWFIVNRMNFSYEDIKRYTNDPNIIEKIIDDTLKNRFNNDGRPLNRRTSESNWIF